MVVAKTSTKSLKSGKLMAPDADVDDCPKYHCVPPGLVAPEQEQEVGVVVESRCRLQGGAIAFFVFFFYFSIRGRSLSTFDGLQLKVDLCHHTLLQSTTGRWSVQCKIFVKMMILTNDCSADDLDQVLNNDCSADHRKCNGVCDNMLQVNLGDQNLTLTEDLQVSKVAKMTLIR